MQVPLQSLVPVPHPHVPFAHVWLFGQSVLEQQFALGMHVPLQSFVPVPHPQVPFAQI